MVALEKKNVAAQNYERIQIVGSAPNSELGYCDVAYFANFSLLSFDANEVRQKCGSIKIFAAASAFIPELGSLCEARRKELQALRDKVYKFKPDEIRIFATRDQYSKPLIHDTIMADEMMSPKDLQDLFFHTIGKKLPFVVWQNLTLDVLKNKSKGYKILRNLILQRMHLTKIENCSAFFRPSTGVTALAYALSQHGERAHYCLTGISFEKRVGHSVFNDQKFECSEFEPHVSADKFFLREADKNYNICSDF